MEEEISGISRLARRPWPAALTVLFGALLAACVSIEPNPSASPSPTAVASTGSGPTWNAILNEASASIKFGVFQVADPLTTHYEIVSLTFENTTSTVQVLKDESLDFQDVTGQHYDEAQASDPGRSFVVQPGHSIQVSLAYVVPNGTCQFRLDLIDQGTVEKSWSITSLWSGCT